MRSHLLLPLLLLLASLAGPTLASLDDVVAVGDMFAGEEIFPTLPIAAIWSNNTRCRADSLALLQNLRNSTTWAMQMWDASAKGPVGVFTGNVYQMGDFDECLAQLRPVRAQYCLATVTVSHRAVAQLDIGADFYREDGSVWEKINYNGDPKKIRRDVIHWALCVPASCSHSDLETSLNVHLATAERNNSRSSVSVEVGAALCQTGRQEETFSTGAIVYCAVLAAIVAIVVGSTIFDYRFCSEEDKGKQNDAIGYLLCFSMRKNFPEIALPEASNHSLDCIYGMRFLSICLITIDHRIGISIAGPIQNYEFVEKQYSRFYSVIFYQGDVLVDTFFVISGLLVTYILCLTLDKKKVNPLLAIVLRYVRLTPVYMVVIFFYATMMYRMGDGPMWDLVVGPERDACAKNWWANLLYVNNYVKDDEMCMIHSWYLPCDTHFFVIALFVVMLMHKHPRTGCSLLALLIVGSALVPFLITLLGQKAPLLYFYSDFLISPRTHHIFQSMYTKSHTRAGPYFIGMATGYFLYRTRFHKKNLTWKSTGGVALSMFVCAVSLVPAFYFYDRDWEYDAVQSAFYAGIHRITWAIGICGFMVALIFSKSSMIGAFLSWSPMISLSKLVYSQYLVHMAIQTIHSASMRNPEHINVMNVAGLAMADICWSLLVALGLYLSVEAPIRLIFKRIMQARDHVPEPVIHEFKYTQNICIL